MEPDHEQHWLAALARQDAADLEAAVHAVAVAMTAHRVQWQALVMEPRPDVGLPRAEFVRTWRVQAAHYRELAARDTLLADAAEWVVQVASRGDPLSTT